MSVGGRGSKGQPINKTPNLLYPVSKLYSYVLICQRAWHFARRRVEAGALGKGQRSKLPQSRRSTRKPEGFGGWMKPRQQTKGWKVEFDKRRAPVWTAAQCCNSLPTCSLCNSPIWEMGTGTIQESLTGYTMTSRTGEGLSLRRPHFLTCVSKKLKASNPCDLPGSN